MPRTELERDIEVLQKIEDYIATDDRFPIKTFTADGKEISISRELYRALGRLMQEEKRWEKN